MGPDPRGWASNWISAEAHFLGWIKAVDHVRMWFPQVDIVTDTVGAKVLVDQLGLRFDNVDILLDHVPAPDGLWAAGKILAYAAQRDPFIHLDADCFLYKPLPDWFLAADAGVQNIEDGGWFDSAYRPEIQHSNAVHTDLPDVWGAADYSICMGLYSCRNMAFNDAYTRAALRYTGGSGWDRVSNPGSYSIVAEQWIAACTAKAMGVPFTYLSQNIFEDGEALGYCHLWGAKKHKVIEDQLRRVVTRDNPGAVDRLRRMMLQR